MDSSSASLTRSGAEHSFSSDSFVIVGATKYKDERGAKRSQGVQTRGHNNLLLLGGVASLLLLFAGFSIGFLFYRGQIDEWRGRYAELQRKIENMHLDDSSCPLDGVLLNSCTMKVSLGPCGVAYKDFLVDSFSGAAADLEGSFSYLRQSVKEEAAYLRGQGSQMLSSMAGTATESLKNFSSAFSSKFPSRKEL